MLLFPWPDQSWTLIALVVFASPLIGTLWAPSMAMLSDGAEAQGIAQGFAFALSNLGWSIGQTAGSAASARLADLTSDTVPYLLLSGLCARFVPRPRPRAQDVFDHDLRRSPHVSITEHALRNLVAGDLVDAVDGGVREVVNPATGEVDRRGARGHAGRCRPRGRRRQGGLPGLARHARPASARTPCSSSPTCSRRTARSSAASSPSNVGKPMAVAREEMPITVDNVRFFAGAARVMEGRAAGEYMAGYTSMVRREPIGVVGQIAPWNYPLMMAIWKIGPALATGNTIVLKPSELTPLTALRLGELAAEVLPPGVLNVITGDGEPVGAGLVRHRDVRLVSLTGRSRRASGSRAPRRTRSSACTSSSAARRRWSCSTTPTRPRSPRASRSPATSTPARTARPRRGSSPRRASTTTCSRRSSPRSSRCKVGDPAEADDLDMGPVVSAEQQARVLGFLDRATAGGAQVLTGGGAAARRAARSSRRRSSPASARPTRSSRGRSSARS